MDTTQEQDQEQNQDQPPPSTQLSEGPVNKAISLHALLLLSDSALPLGSFAFSSGLESFLAHHSISGPKSPQALKSTAFSTFLTQSLHNIASTSLPFVLAAYEKPGELQRLDNDLDAQTTCTVARRASVSQGRALVGVWERALSSSLSLTDASTSASSSAAVAAARELSLFASTLKSPLPSSSDPLFPDLKLQAHFAPLFGVVCLALNLSMYETAYIFLMNHAKAVLSAAVRASVMGPYQSQGVLASGELRGVIERCVELYGGGGERRGGREKEATVTVPMMDLWMGRHELLYSRIFNS